MSVIDLMLVGADIFCSSIAFTSAKIDVAMEFARIFNRRIIG